MARILKDEKKCSIQEGLFEYGREFQRLMVALWVILFLLFFLIITQHKQDMDYFLTLNEFYDRLEEVNGGLYSDIIGNVGENFQGTREKLELMDEKLKILQRLNVGNGFIRDMDDLGDMYDRYRSEVEKIYEFLGTENIDVEMVFEYYENTQSAFTFLNKDFQKMYSQILTFVKEKEEKQYVQKLFLLGVLVVVFSVLTRMKMKNTKLLVEKIAGPIKELAQEAKEVKTGDFLNQSLKTGESYFEEIDILQHVFASMLETLKKQMKEIIENANLKDQMRKKKWIICV